MSAMKKLFLFTFIFFVFIFIGCEEVITDEWTLIPHNNGVGVWKGTRQSVAGETVTAVANLRSDSAFIITVALGSDTLFEEVGNWYMESSSVLGGEHYTIELTGTTYKHWDTTGAEVTVSTWTTLSPITEKTMSFDYNDHMNLIEGDYKYDNFTLTYEE